MSGTITVGRVGVANTNFPVVPLNVPDSGQWRGETMTIGNDIDPVKAGGGVASVLKARVLRQQLQGLASMRPGPVPCTFSDTPELDGYYWVRNVTLSSPRNDPGFATGSFGWQLELERCPAWSAPLVQSRVQGALRAQPSGSANAHGISTANTLAWWSPGPVSPAVTSLTGVPSASQVFRTHPDGTAWVFYDTAETLFDATPSWFTPPADYYKCAAGVAMQYETGGSYYPVVGSQIQNRPGSWSISNGLVVVLGSSNPVAEFSVLWWGGTAYESFKTFRLTGASGSQITFAASGVRVLANTPERAAVRIYFAQSGIAGRLTLDLSIRRGARHVDCLLTAAENQTWGVKQSANVSGTNHTSGIHAASADGDGNFWILSSPQAVTTNTGTGAMELSSAQSRFAFMVGAEMAGSGAGDTFTDVVFQYFAAQSERQRVVVS